MRFDGQKFQQARGKMSRAKLGDAIGKTGVTIWRWETGQHAPDANDLAACADALGVDVRSFFSSDVSTNPLDNNTEAA